MPVCESKAVAPVIIGVGGVAATRRPGHGVRTLALGSCVAVVFLDPITHCVGMAHIALPDSQVNSGRARECPGHFADTGIPELLQQMQQGGASSKHRGYLVKLVGGANVLDPHNTFNIGKRNVAAIKKILWKYNMGVRSEDVGGRISRSVTVDVATGSVRVSSPGRGEWKV